MWVFEKEGTLIPIIGCGFENEIGLANSVLVTLITKRGQALAIANLNFNA